MATVTTVNLVDDIHGGEAHETVQFGLDGKRFEIDLSDENAAVLRNALAGFVAHARKASAPQPKKAPASRSETKEARAWLQANGYQLSERGRIPTELWAAYWSGTPKSSGQDVEPEQVTDQGDDDWTPAAPEAPLGDETAADVTASVETEADDATIIAWAESLGKPLKLTKAGRPTARMIRDYRSSFGSAE